MSDTAAAIALRDRRLRYAEVEQNSSGTRVRRVEDRDFEVDVGRRIFGTSRGSLAPVVNVLEEYLPATASRALGVAVHPPDSYSFFAPVASNLSAQERKQRLAQRVALVTGERSLQEFRVVSTRVRTEEAAHGAPIEWIHVLAVPSSVDARLQDLVRGLPVRTYSCTVVPEAAVYALIELGAGSSTDASGPSYTMTVGQYDTHTEFSLAQGTAWYHAQYTEETTPPENQLYFAVGFLNRIGVTVETVDRVLVYGDAITPASASPFEEVLGQPPERLELRPAVGGQSGQDRSETSAFVPCVGAALKEVVR